MRKKMSKHQVKTTQTLQAFHVNPKIRAEGEMLASISYKENQTESLDITHNLI